MVKQGSVYGKKTEEPNDFYSMMEINKAKCFSQLCPLLDIYCVLTFHSEINGLTVRKCGTPNKPILL